MTRVAVIGAGVAGLACAARLAARGHDVQVFEQADLVGGKLGVHEQDGYRFDTGPSLLTWPQLVTDVLEATAQAEPAAAASAAGPGAGLDLELEQVDPIARYLWPDGTTLDAHADRERMRRSFDTGLGLGTGAAWARLMDRAERMWQAIEGPILSQPQPSVAGLANQARRLGDLQKIAPHRSLRSIGQQYLHHPLQRQFLERYATYTGSDPRRAPAVLATIPWLEQSTGAWYVPGGLHRIAEVLAERITALGGEVHTASPVITVATEGDRVIGVTLADGTRVPADVVVSNTEARTLYGRLLEHPDAPRWRRELERVEPSLSGFVVLLGLEGRTPDLAHHTVLFNADYDAEFDAIFGSDPQPVPDPTIYVSIPRDPTAAPADGEAWFVLVNAARQGPVDWDRGDTAARYAEHIIDLLAKRGVDVRHRIRMSTHITPADLARRTGAIGGAIYGTSSNGWRAASMRPANRGPLEGLYLVGGSAHPGGGLPLVLKSAEITANLIGDA